MSHPARELELTGKNKMCERKLKETESNMNVDSLYDSVNAKT